MGQISGITRFPVNYYRRDEPLDIGRDIEVNERLRRISPGGGMQNGGANQMSLEAHRRNLALILGQQDEVNELRELAANAQAIQARIQHVEASISWLLNIGLVAGIGWGAGVIRGAAEYGDTLPASAGMIGAVIIRALAWRYLGM